MKLNEVLAMAKEVKGLEVVSVKEDKDGDMVATFFLEDVYLDDNWNEVDNPNVDWEAWEDLQDELMEKGQVWDDYLYIYKMEDGFVKVNMSSQDI